MLALHDTGHSAWKDYKEALAAVARAASRFEEAQAGNGQDVEEAEREFGDALRVYNIVRARMIDAGIPEAPGESRRRSGHAD